MDHAQGCPGRDRSNWTPDDIFEVPCAAWCAAADKCSVGRNALGE